MKFNCPYTSITQPIWAVVLNMLSFWLPNELSRSKISFFNENTRSHHWYIVVNSKFVYPGLDKKLCDIKMLCVGCDV